MAFPQHLREQTSILLKKHFVIFQGTISFFGCLDTGSVGLGEEESLEKLECQGTDRNLKAKPFSSQEERVMFCLWRLLIHPENKIRFSVCGMLDKNPLLYNSDSPSFFVPHY